MYRCMCRMHGRHPCCVSQGACEAAVCKDKRPRTSICMQRMMVTARDVPVECMADIAAQMKCAMWHRGSGKEHVKLQTEMLRIPKQVSVCNP